MLKMGVMDKCCKCGATSREKNITLRKLKVLDDMFGLLEDLSEEDLIAFKRGIKRGEK